MMLDVFQSIDACDTIFSYAHCPSRSWKICIRLDILNQASRLNPPYQSPQMGVYLHRHELRCLLC